jgi:hypothetical protein
MKHGAYSATHKQKDQTQSRSTNSPAWKKPRAQTSGEGVLIALSYCRGIVHKEFVPQRRIINQYVYKCPLQLLDESIRRRRPEFSLAGKWFLAHENARRHMTLFVKDFLSVHQIAVLPHGQYSPDLSPCHFFSLRTKGPSVWLHSGHSDSRHKTAQLHSGECFPGMLQRHTEKLEAVY